MPRRSQGTFDPVSFPCHVIARSVNPALRKPKPVCLHGYRIWGTHTHVFSQTLAHGNSKNEIRQRNARGKSEERREYGKKQSEERVFIIIVSKYIYFLIRRFLTATSGTKPIIVFAGMFIFSCTKERNEEVPFRMAIGNGELMHECFPKHSRMGTARMK